MPYFKYQGQDLFYDDRGLGNCLLFVHEWNSSSLTFRKRNLKYFEKDFRVICIDLPGYGNSEYVAGLEFDDFSNILIGLLDCLKIPKCTLMGFCLGTIIILDFYKKFPDRISNLVLVEPIVTFPTILVPLLIPRFGTFFLRSVVSNKILFSLIGNQLTGAKKQLNRKVHKGISKSDPQISVEYLKLLFKKNKESSFRTLDYNIQDNCICIFGKNTNFIFRKNAQLVLIHFNIRHYFVMDDTSHFIFLERPTEVSGIILNHFKTIE
jgi:pimeloyl-ACP methyl ester carboxylesterase